jgi:hypothetical protein
MSDCLDTAEARDILRGSIYVKGIMGVQKIVCVSYII